MQVERPVRGVYAASLFVLVLVLGFRLFEDEDDVLPRFFTQAPYAASTCVREWRGNEISTHHPVSAVKRRKRLAPVRQARVHVTFLPHTDLLSVSHD